MSEDIDGTVTVRPAGAVQPLTPFERFRDYCLNRAALDGANVSAELAEQQVTTLINATTPEDVFNALKLAGLTALKNLDDGTEIEITGFHFVPGSNDDYANRLGVFVVIEAIAIATGLHIALDTGIERIIGALRAWEAMEAFPVQCTVRKQRTTAGREMVTLAPLSQRPVPSTTA